MDRVIDAPVYQDILTWGKGTGPFKALPERSWSFPVELLTFVDESSR